MTRGRKGRYKVKYPEKYRGDPTNIIYRSSWEKKLMTLFDERSDVIAWCSEEVVIPYMSPLDKKIHRYFPDFLVIFKQKDGSHRTVLIEVKPWSQTQVPTKQKRVTKRLIHEVTTYSVNDAKWQAAEAYCRKKNWEFKIVTEKDLKF
jgi:hypothetical protein